MDTRPLSKDEAEKVEIATILVQNLDVEQMREIKKCFIPKKSSQLKKCDDIRKETDK